MPVDRTESSSRGLFRIAADHRQQVVAAAPALGIAEAGARDMRLEVMDAALVEQAVHRAAHRGEAVQHLGPVLVRTQRALDAGDLSPDAPATRQTARKGGRWGSEVSGRVGAG